MKRCVLTMLLTVGLLLTASAQNSRLQTLPQQTLLSSEQPVQVLQDGEGYLWYGSIGSGLCRFDGYDRELFRSDRKHPNLLLSNDVLCITEQRENAEIWFGTKDGAYILDKHDYSIRPIVVSIPADDNQTASTSGPQQTDSTALNELADKRITCMKTARDGSVWLSFRNQLLHLSAKAELQERFTTIWNRKNRSIVSLCFDAADNVWLGLWNGGIVSLKKTDGTWTMENCPWLRSDYPAVLEWIDGRNALLVRTSEGSALLYTPQTQSLEVLDEHAVGQLTGDMPSSQTVTGTEWVDSIMRRLAPHNDASVLSRAILPDGSAFVGSYHSLFRCDHEHVELLQGDLDKVRSMAYSDRLQTLFFLSKARGICQWKDRQLTVLSDTSLFRDLQLLDDSVLLLSDGIANVTRFHLRTRQFTADSLAADIRLLSTAYFFDGRKHLVGYGQQEILVPQETELVEISFSSLDYERAPKVLYAYRLNDDGAWTELPEGEHVARFSSLSAGRNQLQVRATDDYGRWSVPVTVITLMRPVAWYAQLWLWLLLALLLAFGIYYAYQKKQTRKTAVVSSQDHILLSAEADSPSLPESPPDDENKLSVADQEFSDKVVATVMANITNSEYSVDALASDLCMSRANLHRKMRTIMGVTPTDFIRNQRLEEAARLLRTTSHSVNEIADMVGFSYASYFTKCFKDKYGVLPKDY